MCILIWIQNTQNCSFILLAVIGLRTQSCADNVHVTKSYYEEMLLFIFLVLIRTLNRDMWWVKYLINQKFKLVFSWKSDELGVLISYIFLRTKGCNITFIFKLDLNEMNKGIFTAYDIYLSIYIVISLSKKPMTSAHCWNYKSMDTS